MNKIYASSVHCLTLVLGMMTMSPVMASTSVETRMSQKELILPEVSAPIANYVPYTITGKTVYISGQVPRVGSEMKFKGRVGQGGQMTEIQATEAAKICALNILAHLKAAAGSLDNVVKCVKLTGYINATPDFENHSQVMNGASDVMVDAFGESGKHARAAVGVASLPLGAVVEIDGIFEIK